MAKNVALVYFGFFILLFIGSQKLANGGAIGRPSVFENTQHAIKDEEEGDDHFATQHNTNDVFDDDEDEDEAVEQEGSGDNDYVFDEKTNQLVKKPTQPPGPPAAQKKKMGGHKRGDSASRLLHNILESYSKEVIPSRPMFVKIDLLLMKVKNTNEKEGIFETVVALFMGWQDKRMVWNPEQYSNITTLTFNPNKLWMPDIAMINCADNQYGITKDYRFLARLSYDGCVKFTPTGTARTWCSLRLISFPFDIQTCSFEFESWSMDSTIFNFNKTSAALIEGSFSSPQWSLCKHKSIVYDYTYNFSNTIDTFSRVRFEYVVRRKSTFYIVNLIFPCATLSLTQLLVFTIPTKKTLSDRIGFGTVNVLTLVVFQTIISRQLPKSSDAISALSDYIIALILMSAAGIFQSVVIEGLLRKTDPPPQWAMKVMKYVPMLWAPPTTDRSVIWENPLQKNRRTKRNKKKTKKEKNEVFSSPLPEIAQTFVRIKICKGSIRPVQQCKNDDKKEAPVSSCLLLEKKEVKKVANNNNSIRRRKRSSRRLIELSVRQWEELITRFDCLIFLLTGATAVVVPIALFLPTIVVDDVLCPDIELA